MSDCGRWISLAVWVVLCVLDAIVLLCYCAIGYCVLIVVDCHEVVKMMNSQITGIVFVVFCFL